MTFKEFNCMKSACESNCCGAFSGITDNIFSIENREFKEIILTPSDLKKIQDNEYTSFVYIGEDGLGRMRTDELGACYAFKNDKCDINEVKPTICKCFPMYLDLFIGLCAIKSCSSVTSEFPERSYSSEIRSFIEMCEFWIDYYKKMLSKTEQGD